MKFQEVYQIVIKEYSTGNRHYHTKQHVDNMLGKITDEKNLDNLILKLFCLFHDVVYDPKSTENELNSVGFFNMFIYEYNIDGLTLNAENIIRELIMATKNHSFYENPTNSMQILHNKAMYLDLSIFFSDFSDLIEYENNIFKEFQYLDIITYTCLRIQTLFNLRRILQLCPGYTNNVSNNLGNLKDYVSNRKYNIGIYAGSFDPFHKGHLDVLNKAEKIFDKVIVARGQNTSKNKHECEIPKTLHNEFIEYKGLLTDLFPLYTKIKFTLIRGLRNTHDLAYEDNLRQWLQELNPNIDIIYIYCDSINEKVNSTTLKELLLLNKNKAKEYIIK